MLPLAKGYSSDQVLSRPSFACLRVSVLPIPYQRLLDVREARRLRERTRAWLTKGYI